MLQPSEERPELAQLAVSPTGRAAHVYLLPGEGERADPAAVGERLAEIEGVDLVCRLLDAEGAPLYRPEPGMPAAGDEWATVERAASSSASGPATTSPTCAAGAGRSSGELGVLEAAIEDGKLRSETYPDPLQRVWSALTAPHSGDFVLSLDDGYEAVDWGGVTHAGGGSHGALHARRQPRAAALRRLRTGVGGRARAVEPARRRSGDPRHFGL